MRSHVFDYLYRESSRSSSNLRSSGEPISYLGLLRLDEAFFASRSRDLFLLRELRELFFEEPLSSASTL